MRVFVKGAPEKVILQCTHYLGPHGQVMELDDMEKDRVINEVVKTYASKCLRTMLVSYVEYDQHTWEQMQGGNMEDAENNLVMIGIFGLKDPLRPGIRDAVKTCHAAGINVRMVTGDNIDTARAISLEAGIITQDDLNDPELAEYLCMEGPVFREAVSGTVTIEKKLVDAKDKDGKLTGEQKEQP